MRLTKLDKAAEIAISVCMGVKKKEKVLIFRSSGQGDDLGLGVYKSVILGEQGKINGYWSKNYIRLKLMQVIGSFKENKSSTVVEKTPCK